MRVDAVKAKPHIHKVGKNSKSSRNEVHSVFKNALGGDDDAYNFAGAIIEPKLVTTQ